jgi:2-polyprenyl-3-methyl-5-hydroxy-6-metoxy-1,4-benzoquinol methylase
MERESGPSPERIYLTPANARDENVRRHVARYEFAAQFIPAGSNVLDCACGSGYGTEILARKALAVCGVDRSPEAIAHARGHRRRENTLYLEHGLESLHFREDNIDAVVTLETLEHVPYYDCRLFLDKARRWIKPGGVLIASSPMLRYRDGSPYVTSPYHLNELPRKKLLEMFETCLPGYRIHYYHQIQEAFVPLLQEDTGFLVVVAIRKM